MNQLSLEQKCDVCSCVVDPRLTVLRSIPLRLNTGAPMQYQSLGLCRDCAARLDMDLPKGRVTMKYTGIARRLAEWYHREGFVFRDLEDDDFL